MIFHNKAIILNFEILAFLHNKYKYYEKENITCFDFIGKYNRKRKEELKKKLK